MPLQFLITAGQVSDYAPATELFGTRKPEVVIADKGYDSDLIVEHIEKSMQTRAVIPPRSNANSNGNMIAVCTSCATESNAALAN